MVTLAGKPYYGNVFCFVSKELPINSLRLLVKVSPGGSKGFIRAVHSVAVVVSE